MPLPTDPKAPWPPKLWAPLQRDVQEADAWYSGSEAKLTEFYAGVNGPQVNRRRRFWGRTNRDDQGRPTERQRLHVPAAADVAATSADLLFGDTPTFDFPDAAAGDTSAQDRLDELGELNGYGALLLEAAEVASALGGVYLRPVWDPAITDHPLLSIVQADCAVPEFAWGILTAVTFWQTIRSDGPDVWRHLERHEMTSVGQPGVILHGLFAGSTSALGKRIPLSSAPELAALGVDDAEQINVPAGIIGIDCRYIPNVKPNRKHRGSHVGRSDYQSTEDLMDALDETYTSWMRDIRLGKARLVVPESYLDRRGRGKGATFDVDAEVFSPLDIAPGADDGKMQLTENQFQIRTADHAATAMALFERIVTTSGYSPQSFGLQGDGGDMTATEVSAREGKSERTTDRKRRYWKRPLEDMGEMLLIIDKAVFGGKATPSRPRLNWPADAGQSPLDESNTLNYLSMAQAASTKVKVQMLHPEWSDDEVATEVALIQAEHAITVPDPATGFGGL